jgi:hypothetical protein
MDETHVTFVEPPRDIRFPIGGDPEGNRFAIWQDIY